MTPIGQVVEESILGILQRYTGVEIDTYCFMPDHVHLLLAMTADVDGTSETGRDRARPLQNIIGAMKSYTDRQYRILRRPSEKKLWQIGYYDHIIRNDEDLQITRQYIQNNPLKWIWTKSHSGEARGL